MTYASYPLAVLELGDEGVKLRVRGSRLFGTASLAAGPAEMLAVFRCIGRSEQPGVGFRTPDRELFVFWAGWNQQPIMDALAERGYPVKSDRKFADELVRVIRYGRP